MATSLLLLLDDIATILDDVSILTKVAAKKTAELIPLCHQLAQTDVEVALALDAKLPGVRVEATVRTVGPTGVEMEALTAVSVALLTVYDMAKSLHKGMRIGGVRLLEKTGGKSGRWTADAD